MSRKKYLLVIDFVEKFEPHFDGNSSILNIQIFYD